MFNKNPNSNIEKITPLIFELKYIKKELCKLQKRSKDSNVQLDRNTLYKTDYPEVVDRILNFSETAILDRIHCLEASIEDLLR